MGNKTKAKKTVRGYSAEQAAAAQEAAARSAQTTPPEILDALFPDGTHIGGHRVHPLSVSAYVFLQKRKNPICEEGGLAKMSNEQLLELCFVITHPLSECSEILAEGGEEAWEEAYMTFGDKIPFHHMEDVGYKVGAVVHQAMATVMPTQPAKKKAAAKSSKRKV